MHFVVGDRDAAWIGGGIEFASDGQAGLGGGRGDQLDDGLVADERLGTPVLADEGEEAVLDFVPLAGARRQMVDLDPEPGLVGQRLQFTLPQTDARTIAAAAVGSDEQPCGTGVAGAAQFLPPAPDAVDGKGGGIMVDPDADPARIGGEIINAIRNRPAKLLDQEVVDPDRLRITLRYSRPLFLKSPTSSFFFVSTEIAGWFSANACFTSVLM